MLWAYGHQRLSETERTLAPIELPSYRFVRCAGLLISSWIAAVGLICLGLLIPVFTGRLLAGLCHVPRRLAHEPLCALAGIITVRIAQRLIYFTRRAVMALPAWRGSMRPLPPGFVRACICTASAWFGFCALAMGGVLHLLIAPTLPDLVEEFRTCGVGIIAQNWLLGLVVLNIGLGLARSGLPDLVLMRVGIIHEPLDTTTRVRVSAGFCLLPR